MAKGYFLTGNDRVEIVYPIDVKAHEFVNIGGMVGFSLNDMKIGELGTLLTRGVFEVDSARKGEIFAIGDMIYFDFDPKAKDFTKTASATTKAVGVSLTVKNAPDTAAVIAISLFSPGALKAAE